MKTETSCSSRQLFSRHDLSGFWALFADNLANLVIISGFCLYVFKIPKAVVLGRILPGLGIALLLGLGFYAWLAIKLRHQTQRVDVTALPYGISTPVMFVYLFGVMMPVYQMGLKAHVLPEKAGMIAWQVGIAAAFLGGVIEASGAVLGRWLKQVTPRAGMLGTLAGIAIVYIAVVPMAEMMEHPLVGFAALSIVLIGLIAHFRLPWGLPAGLVAIVVGVLVAVVSGQITWSNQPFASLGFYPPLPVFGDVWQGLSLLFTQFPYLLIVILPIEIYNFIETMNNVESAEAAGDSYPVGLCQVMDGTGTMVGALFGSPFPTTVYIGHPAYKRLGARSGYALGVGFLCFLITTFGMMHVLHHWIPVAAVAPILVFVGLSVTAQAFQATPKAHAVAVAFAMLPHIADILVLRMKGVLRETGNWLAPLATQASHTLQTKIKLLQQESFPPDLIHSFLSRSYIHFEGQVLLSRGAIVVGLLWGAIVASLIDRQSVRATWFAAGAWGLTVLGIIHSPQGPGFYWNSPIAWGYFLLVWLCFSTRYLSAQPESMSLHEADPAQN